jgi:S-adenosylmethionine:tRNA ribosyltransferase-isomerase
MNYLPSIALKDFDYTLDEKRIAKFPLSERSDSKLLHYQRGTDLIIDSTFFELPKFLPPNSFLVANNTKVIPARLIFNSATGTKIEVFLLKPLDSNWSCWEVMVGNRKKFPEGSVLCLPYFFGGKEDTLYVKWINREDNIIQLSSATNQPIAQVIDHVGKVPLPPYIRREVSEEDKERYQAIFAGIPGAVAAPTASLHFSHEVESRIIAEGHSISKLTLHVGAGTFLPVTASTSDQHHMHAEQFEINIEFLTALKESNGSIIPIGTTSMRVLESIRFIGAKALLKIDHPEIIEPDSGFNPTYLKMSIQECLDACINLAALNEGKISGSTSIFILPGFHFAFSNGLITNFHQPGSTLLMLLSAFIGDKWKEIYSHAIEKEYRFLSYGDACFFL